jgi:hypothetical protein
MHDQSASADSNTRPETFMVSLRSIFALALALAATAAEADVRVELIQPARR